MPIVGARPLNIGRHRRKRRIAGVVEDHYRDRVRAGKEQRGGQTEGEVAVGIEGSAAGVFWEAARETAVIGSVEEDALDVVGRAVVLDLADNRVIGRAAAGAQLTLEAGIAHLQAADRRRFHIRVQGDNADVIHADDQLA